MGDDVKIMVPYTFRNLEMIFVRNIFVTLQSIFRIPGSYVSSMSIWYAVSVSRVPYCVFTGLYSDMCFAGGDQEPLVAASFGKGRQ